MNNKVKIFSLILAISLVVGCNVFKDEYVTFSYNDSVYSDYKCKISDNKINCAIVNPTNDDLTFMGWYDENDNKVDLNGKFKNSIVLHPKFLTEEEAQKEKLSEKKYIVTFDLNGGKGDFESIEIEYEGQLPKLNNIPTKENYVFLGFFDNKKYYEGKQYYDNKGDSVRNFDKVENTMFYAAWMSNKYNITFDLNEGSGNKPESIDIKYGDDLPKLNEIPSKTGYIFKGWYDNKNYLDGKQYYNEKNEAVSKYDRYNDVVLYAGWQNVEEPVTLRFIITFDLNGADGNKPSNIEAIYGEKMPQISGIPSRDSYTFMGWYDGKNWEYSNQYYNEKNESSHDYDKKSNLTLYAGWEKKADVAKYRVAFNSNGGSGGPTSYVEAVYGERMPNISEIPSKRGYTFKGWYDSVSGGTQYYNEKNESSHNYDKKSSTTLYARWEANTFTVEYNGNGSTSGSTESHTCTYDSECLLASSGYKKDGYIFIGWKKENSGSTKSASTSIKNVVTSGKVTYYAVWQDAKYQVTFELNGGTGSKPNNVTATYGQNMPAIGTVEITKKGYTFIGWYDSTSGGSKYYNIDGSSAKKYDKYSNSTLYARWEAKTYTVKFNLNGGSGTKPSDVTATYDSTMPKINVAKPTKANNKFMGWYDKTDWTKGTKYYNVDGTSARPYNKTSATVLYAGWKSTGVEVKIASFNVGYYACGSSSISCSPKVDDFVNLINKYRIDIIGMQEARNNGYNTNYAESIGDKTGLKNKHITKPANVNAILSKYEFKSKTNTLMGCGETRSLDKTIINIGGVDISYYNTHLGLKTCNTEHFQKIAEILGADPNPIIITGDYNSTPITKFNTYLAPLGFEIAAYDTSSHNMWNKPSYCDGVWILSKGHIDIVSSEVADAYEKYSDHNMIVSTLLIH